MTSQVLTNEGRPDSSGRPPAAKVSRRPWWAAGLRLTPMAPAIILLLLFFVGPVIWAVYVAFTNTGLTGPLAANPEFVGFDNFKTLFTDANVINSVKLTLLFTVFSVLGQNFLGMILALTMRKRNVVIKAVVGAIVVGAWVVPEIVAAFMWSTFLQAKTGLSDGGTLNIILHTLFGWSQDWLVSAPMLAIVLTNVWRGTAFSMMIFSAAAGDISPDLIEAAEVDGASAWKRLWNVIIPSMRKIIATNLLLTTLQTLGVFGLIYALTRGGPNNESQTLPILMYVEAFGQSKVGYGSAIALVLLAIGAIFSFVYLFMLKPDKK